MDEMLKNIIAFSNEPVSKYGIKKLLAVIHSLHVTALYIVLDQESVNRVASLRLCPYPDQFHARSNPNKIRTFTVSAPIANNIPVSRLLVTNIPVRICDVPNNILEVIVFATVLRIISLNIILYLFHFVRKPGNAGLSLDAYFSAFPQLNKFQILSCP